MSESTEENKYIEKKRYIFKTNSSIKLYEYTNFLTEVFQNHRITIKIIKNGKISILKNPVNFQKEESEFKFASIDRRGFETFTIKLEADNSTLLIKNINNKSYANVFSSNVLLDQSIDSIIIEFIPYN